MRYFFLLFYFFLVNLNYGQQLQDNYNVKWVDDKNGLKQLSIRYCVPDDYGFVWIATELGLYRYDGSNLTQIIEDKYPSLSKQRITRLGKDVKTGKIYLQTYPENIQYVIDNNTIHKINSKDNWKKAIFTFNSVCYTESTPLIKRVLINENIENFIQEYSLNTILSATLTTNFLYLPQKGYLNVFNKYGQQTKLNHSFSTGSVFMQFNENVLAANNGEIIVISDGQITTKKVKVDKKIQYFLDRKLINLSPIEVFGSKNHYFLKYNGQIFKINFKNSHLSTQFLFNAPAEDISTISYIEKDELYFIGTRTRGLAIIKPIRFHTLLFDESVTNKSINYCYSISEISENNWYNASGWQYDFTKKKSKIENFLIDFRNPRFILPYKNQFYINAQNDLWNIKTLNNDFDLKKIRSKKVNLSGFSGFTYFKSQLYLSDSDIIYTVKDKVLLIYEPLYKKFIGKQINGIYSLNNLLIISTTKGVYSYSPGNDKPTLVIGLENVNARYIKPIDKQSYWVGCYGEGLFLVDQNKVYHVIDSSVELTTAHAIEEDKQGDLWISTNDGLLKINKRIALKKILNNQPINCYKYSTEDGLLTNEFNGSGTHPSLQTKEGIIGFPSMKGFVWFDPNHVPKHLFNGKIVMDKVLVDNNNPILPVNSTYYIPDEAGFITFNFNYGYYYNRQNLTVSYRLDDQTNWTEVQGNTFQIARYKKGDDKLFIKISTHGFSKKNDVIQSFDIHFETRYYETWWFLGICVLFFVSFIYVAFSIGLVISKKSKEKLKLKIEEKTSQLQAMVVELESSQKSITESLNQKNILLKEIHHRVKNNLQLVMSILNIQAADEENNSIEGFIEKGQSRIASMVLIHENLYQKEDISNIDFETYIESLVINIRNTFGDISDRITVNTNVKNVFFDIQTSIPLGLIINELVTNSFKHGFPNGREGQISISIEILSETEYKLRIEDTGIGIQDGKLEKKSIGLELVSLLILQLRGKLTVDSKNGTSYEIIFTV